MRENKEFVLSDEELVYISGALDNQYSFDAISWVHQGILVAPRLISMDVLPGSKSAGLLDPDFNMTSLHVVSAIRMMGLSKFGMMYFYLTHHYKLYGWEDVGLIIAAIKYHHDLFEENSSALWVASLVDLKACPDSFFSDAPIFAKTLTDEIDLCDNIMLEAFDILEPEKDMTLKMGIEKFIDAMDKIVKQSQENGDVEDLTADDITE